MVQCLLINAGLKQDMWGEAIHMVVMLYNRTPSVRNGGKSLYELYYSEKPDLMHVHQFGAPVHTGVGEPLGQQVGWHLVSRAVLMMMVLRATCL
jgi:hypothetical protein